MKFGFLVGGGVIICTCMKKASEETKQLFEAIQNNADIDTIKSLILQGADVSSLCLNQNTALMVAAYYTNNPYVIKLLMMAGACIEKKSLNGWSPLMLAIIHNRNSGVVKELINEGANINAVNENGETPLILAAGYVTDIDVIKLLIQPNNINVTDYFRTTALIKAARLTENPDVIKVLLEAGSDAKKLDFAGKNALDYANNNLAICHSYVYKILQDTTVQ